MSHRAGNGWNWTLLGVQTVHSTQIFISRDLDGYISLDHFSWDKLESVLDRFGQFHEGVGIQKFGLNWVWKWLSGWRLKSTLHTTQSEHSLCHEVSSWNLNIWGCIGFENNQRELVTRLPAIQLSLNTVSAMKDQVCTSKLQLLPLCHAHIARHNDAPLQTVPVG